MNFKPPPKRKRVDPTAASSSPSTHCTLAVNLPSETIPMGKAMVQQKRDNAVAQAQQDGCTANFRIFDSAFGNYLVPVIPTRSELGG